MKKSFVKIIAPSLAIAMLIVVSFGYTPEVVNTVNDIAISRSIPSAVVWSDNFDDEDISDWQLFTVNHTVSPDTLHSGTSNAEGGVLRQNGTEWSYAGHNSSVAFGTWSFDVDIQDPFDEYHFTIIFSSEMFNDDWLTLGTIGEGYAVIFYINPREGRIELGKSSHDYGPDVMDVFSNATIDGWRNIIVTRELSGQFYVYLEGNLILKGTSLHHTTSERFYFLSHGGPAIDNVTVSDTIDYDAAPPEWVQPLNDQFISTGASFYYDLNATDYSGIDEWWIEYTEFTQMFVIDDDGVITNIGNLVEWGYLITVSVNDTLGNTQTDTFMLNVGDPMSGPHNFPMELVVVAAGVSVVVILVLVIWRTRK